MIKRLLPLAALFFLPSLSAESYYVAAGVDYNKIKLADKNYNPLMSKLKFGVVAEETRFLKGIGVELVVGQSNKDDTVDGYNLDIDQHVGIYTTFSTQDKKALNFSLNLGYSETELSTFSDSLGNGLNETYEGISYGFSFQDRISQASNFAWLFDCTRFYSDDNLKMDSCGLGVQYDF